MSLPRKSSIIILASWVVMKVINKKKKGNKNKSKQGEIFKKGERCQLGGSTNEFWTENMKRSRVGAAKVTESMPGLRRFSTSSMRGCIRGTRTGGIYRTEWGEEKGGG